MRRASNTMEPVKPVKPVVIRCAMIPGNNKQYKYRNLNIILHHNEQIFFFRFHHTSFSRKFE